ncbi:MAG: hypothetical protein JNL63_12800 [Bacteroidia bacterium]|nr:hypothetical protein [Bacteroidia bacterium]
MNVKPLALNALVVLIGFNAFGQSTDSITKLSPKKLILEFYAGKAISFGDYSKVSGRDAGFAKNGLDVKADLSYRIQKFIGVGISATYFYNETNKEALGNQIRQSSLSTNLGAVENFILWQGKCLFVGPRIYYDIGKISFVIKTNFGLMYIKKPFYGIKYSNTAVLQQNIQYSFKEIGKGFCFNLGINARIPLQDRVDLFFQAGYTAAKPEIIEDKVVTESGVLIKSIRSRYNQQVSNFDLGVGIAFKIL